MEINKLFFGQIRNSVAQCLHEGETQAVLLRKKGPVRCRAVPCRALYPEFLSRGTRLRSVKSGKPLSGERNIREKNTLLLWTLPKGPREKSVIGGKALYPGRVISEFHCTSLFAAALYQFQASFLGRWFFRPFRRPSTLL